MKNFILSFVFFFLSVLTAASGPIRIKDLVEFDGVRGNDLVGYGLVVGLNGTGDGIRNAPFTDYAVQLATFSGVEQQVKTNDLLASLGQQMGLMGLSQLAGWVGMEARVAAPANFNGAPITVFTAPDATSDQATLIVRNEAGTEVFRSTIDPAGGPIQWAGVDSNGSPLPMGQYSFNVESYSGGTHLGTNQAQLYSLVVEAKTDNGEGVLVLEGGAQVPADQITAIRSPAG